MICPACRTLNRSGAKFCDACGTALVAKPAELETPAHLARKILEERGRIEGERRTVTVLFADAKGFTPLSERLGEEKIYEFVQRCVELMCYGMPRFQFNASPRGLAHATDLDDYCYYVAGVVGEMLTDLFCEYSPEIGRQRAALSALAASFAQGLQMTNILKDVWEDRSRGACWLPQEVFTRYGIDLADLSSGAQPPRFPGRHIGAGELDP